jgi:hypothetical protein
MGNRIEHLIGTVPYRYMMTDMENRKKRVISQYQEITDPKILEFLSAQDEKTRKTYTCNFRKVLEFTKGESGSKMLEECEEWSRKILVFRQWLLAQEYAEGYVQACAGMLRGFFTFNRKTLELSRQDTRKLNKKSRKGEDFVITQSILKQLVECGDLKAKYVCLGGASFGIRPEDYAEKLTYGFFRCALEQAEKDHLEAPIPCGTILTTKERIPATLFISSDFLPIVKAILDGNKEAKDSEPVWKERSTQLTSVLQNLAKKAGIETHGKALTFTCLRDFLFTQLSSIGSEENAKLIVGKKVSGADSPYLKTDLREVYQRAEARICIGNGNGETKRKVSALEQENLDLKARIAELEKEKVELQTNQNSMSKSIGELNDFRDMVEKKLNIKQKVQFT